MSYFIEITKMPFLWKKNRKILLKIGNIDQLKLVDTNVFVVNFLIFTKAQILLGPSQNQKNKSIMY